MTPRAAALTRHRAPRQLVEVCKACGGWVTLAPTVYLEPATDHGATVSLRIAPDHELGDYAIPWVGGCRCPDPYSGDRSAQAAEWLAWCNQAFDPTWPC